MAAYLTGPLSRSLPAPAVHCHGGKWTWRCTTWDTTALPFPSHRIGDQVGVRAGQVTRTSSNRRTAWCVPGPKGPLSVTNTIGVRGRKTKFVKKWKSLRKKRGLSPKPQNSCRTSREQALFLPQARVDQAFGRVGQFNWSGPLAPVGGGKARALGS